MLPHVIWHNMALYGIQRYGAVPTLDHSNWPSRPSHARAPYTDRAMARVWRWKQMNWTTELSNHVQVSQVNLIAMASKLRAASDDRASHPGESDRFGTFTPVRSVRSVGSCLMFALRPFWPPNTSAWILIYDDAGGFTTMQTCPPESSVELPPLQTTEWGWKHLPNTPNSAPRKTSELDQLRSWMFQCPLRWRRDVHRADPDSSVPLNPVPPTAPLEAAWTHGSAGAGAGFHAVRLFWEYRGNNKLSHQDFIYHHAHRTSWVKRDWCCTRDTGLSTVSLFLMQRKESDTINKDQCIYRGRYMLYTFLCRKLKLRVYILHFYWVEIEILSLDRDKTRQIMFLL